MAESAQIMENFQLREFTPNQELFLATSLRQARLELAGQEATDENLQAGVKGFIAADPKEAISLSQLTPEDIEAYVKACLSGREYLKFDELLANVTKLSNFAREELSQAVPEEIAEQIEAEGEVLDREIEERLDNLGAKRGIGKALQNFLEETDLRFKRAVLITASSLLFSFGADAYQKFTSPLPVFAVSEREKVQNLTESELEALGLTTGEEKATSTPVPTVEPTATAEPSSTQTPLPATPIPTEVSLPTRTPEPPIVPTVEREIKEVQKERVNVLQSFYQKIENHRRARAESDPDFLARIDEELNENRINTYIVGYDVPQNGVARGDTVIVASYDLRSGKLTLMRIPRDVHAPEVDDLTANYKGHAFRINAATVFGDSEDMRRILENATGLSVDIGFYMDLEGFKDIIAMVGGIDIEVDEDFVKRYGHKFTEKGWELKVGVNHFNAEQAQLYVRERKADSDYHRGARQLQALEAVVRKLRQNPELILHNLDRIRQLQEGGYFRVSGDFSLVDLLSLARQAGGMREELELDFFAPWGGLLESGRFGKDRYQTSLRGGNINSNNPLDYWYPLRNALANHLRAQNP